MDSDFDEEYTDRGIPDIVPGDVVRVEEGIGVVRYLADVRFASGEWAGVELVEKNGIHDGSVNGRRYFKCRQGFGIFAEIGKVQQKIYPEELLERVTLLHKEKKTLKKENDKLLTRVTELEEQLGGPHSKRATVDFLGEIFIGDRVRLSNRKVGTVRYIGRTHFDANVVYGLELDSWLSNGNDGSKAGRRYFKCKNGFGYFSPKKMIIEVVERAREKPEEPAARFPDLQVGDRIEIDRGRKGTVKYIGRVNFGDGNYVGLELDHWTAYGHDGKLKGRRYFQAAPGRGYFTKLSSVKRVLSDTGTDKGPDDDLPPSLEHTKESIMYTRETIRHVRRKSLNSLVVGDKVRLVRGRVGWVRYIGRVSFTSGEVIGLELDAWTEKGHDGTVQGQKYFTCPPGRGYFTKRSKIDEILETFDSQILQNPSFREQSAENEVKSTPKVSADKNLEFEIGDKVELARGRTGRVRFIGAVEGMRSSEVVGLELDQWSEKGHDGRFKGQSYYKCQPGRGYWTSRSAVTKIIARKSDEPELSPTIQTIAEKWKRKKGIREPKHERKDSLDVAVGDHVALSRGREGVIRFIGEIPGMKEVEVIGLELDQWLEKGHDGSWRGKHYFHCSPGRGYFTSRSAITKVTKPAPTPTRHTPGRGTRDEKREIIPVAIGDRVRLRNNRAGTVQFIGEVEFAKGKTIGLELDQWAPKGNDGSQKGVKYFDCAAGHGYFTRPEAVVEKLGAIRPRSRSSIIRRSSRKDSDRHMRRRVSNSSLLSETPGWDESTSTVDPKLGDRVRLKRGKVGIVRYIGPVSSSNTGELIGIELDQWYEKGNDGSFRGEQLFSVANGWAT